MNTLLWVALGGAIGASGRHMLSRVSLHAFGTGFPWGTFMANVLGSLAIGLVVGWMVYTAPHSQNLRAFLVVGVLGGFTTFSAFSLESANMIKTGNLMQAVLYMGGSVAVCLMAVFAGLWITKVALS